MLEVLWQSAQNGIWRLRDEWINYLESRTHFVPWEGPDDTSFSYAIRDVQMRAQSTPETLGRGVLHCIGLTIPEAVTQLSSLMTMWMAGFWNSRSQVVDLNYQQQGELNYCNIWWGRMGQFISVCMFVCVLVAQLRPILCNPWTGSSLSMGFSRQEY